MTQENTAQDNKPKAFSFSLGYRRYVLGLLMLIYFISFIDRQIFSILLQSIKKDLLISDSLLGVLTGLAFALFYTTLGIPIARLADRFSRRNIIVIALSLWSVMTALCGLAVGFWSLFFARMGVGVGEAGSTPPSHSIVSDYFPAKERATALSILACGGPIAVGVGFALGGILNEMMGWRETFIVVGLPGVAVGLLALFTLREPPRGHADGMTDTGQQPGFFETFGYLLKCRTFLFLSTAMSMHSFVAYGLLNWMPAFFERTHGLTTSEIGTKLGISAVLGGVCGMLPGGFLADRLAKRDLRWYSWVGGISLVSSVPFIAVTLMSTNTDYAFIAFGFVACLLNVCVGNSFSIAQSIAPLRMRASSTALFFLIVNLIGIGLGPMLVGVMSDVFASHGDDSLKSSLMLLIVVPILSGTLFALTAPSISRDYVNPHPGKRI